MHVSYVCCMIVFLCCPSGAINKYNKQIYTLDTLEYKLAFLVYGAAASYLADELRELADFEARCRLRSASSSSLVIRRTRLSTVGDRAFPVVAARVWNSLPQHVTSAQSLPVFCSRLQTLLPMTMLLCLRSDIVILDTLIVFLIYVLTYLLTYLLIVTY